ncbi:TonB-dependent receptor plug domain-containing protein [Sphingomonas alba]|uniref:TonB-dependent receptor n=1 Tax=Sphingomonas alba TaxID=2908208 RepID=A0ABT0RLU2_9SPHN|nr:TonB-dependent receptor [Sphingomonas alba]MCL6683616.1 TonB-dependent receptor [Sphingomonas alba]
MRKSNLRATAAWQALALLGAGVLATPAMAQDAPPASGETSPPAEEQPALSDKGKAEASDEAIVVTGSRLIRPELDAPSPVTTVDSETFDLTGTVTVESLLNELPQIIPGNTRVSNNQGGEDFSTLDLRGLGPNRTLILVDGERVPASSSSGVVDIGTIPAGLIERVDVVTGGASAVYGSDAIAGVVNFILKDNYEGLELSSQYGISDHGDGASFNVQGLLGGNFGDDRGNMTLFASYYTRDPVGQGDRDLFRNAAVVVFRGDHRVVADHLVLEPGDIVTGAGGSGTPPWGWIANDAANPFANLSTAVTTGPGGVTNNNFDAGVADTNCDGVANAANVNTGNISFDQNGLLSPRNTSGLCNFADRSTGSSRYNFNPVNYLVTPYKRYNFAATARYDISDAIRLKVVGNYTDSTQEVNLAPTPATGIVVDPTLNPFIVANGACGVQSCHPDLLAALQTRANPDAPFTIDRRFSETGPRIGLFNAKTQTLRGTLSGPLAHGFNWDETASYGKTADSIRAIGNINNTAVAQGLAGCTGPGVLPNCVPLDIFGANTIDADMLSFVRIDTQETRTFDQVRIAGNITGNLVDLPAGPVGVAVGAEARTDKGEIIVDDAQRNGDIYGFNAVQNQKGKVNVKEVYGEVRIPILADLPFVHELSFEAGARYSDYSSAGGLFNWKAGLQWAPTDWLKFRGIYNKAARAPSIVELFQNGDQGFPSYTDPCNATETPTGATIAQCNAFAPLINFSLPSSDPASFHQNNDQVQTFAFGNPGLSEETAKTFTIGAVLTPNLGLGRFSATVDYYNIKIDDIISAFGAQFFINDCYLNLNAASCARVTRDPATGQLTAVNSATGNQGTFKTSGIDVGLNYSVPFNDIGLGIGGRLRVQELLSWLNEIDFGTGDFAGKTGGGIGGTFPEWKSTLTVAYDSDDFTAQMRWNYLSETVEAFGDEHDPRLPALSYFDLSLRKSIGNNFELTGIIQNLFDAKPKQTPAGDSGFRVNAAYYNPVILGRYFTIQGKVKL